MKGEFFPGEYLPRGSVQSARKNLRLREDVMSLKDLGRQWRKDGREGTVCGGEALVKGAESIWRQESTGKGGFPQAGEQTLAQNLTVTEEMHAHGCHVL